MTDFIIILVVAFLLYLAVAHIRKNKAEGKSGCGCGSSCSGCNKGCNLQKIDKI